jgi:SAM-dependent methyltransferase
VDGAFTDGAEWYDALGANPGRLEREGPFLLGALGRAGGRRVLDTACGTGLHALWLAEHGASVRAADLSPGMVAVARARRAHPEVVHRVGDMRLPPAGPWDLILCLGNSLSLLPAEADVDAFFQNTVAVLAPEGRIVAQVLNYALPAAAQPRTRTAEAVVDGVPVCADKRFTPENGRTRLEIVYTAVRGGAVQTFREEALLRHWSRAFLEEAARAAGLVGEACHGGFDGAPFDPERSPDLILTLRRA